MRLEELNLFSNIHLKLPEDGLKHQNHPGVKVDVLNAQSDIFLASPSYLYILFT